MLLSRQKLLVIPLVIYIQYESDSDRNETLSVEEYLNNIRPYLKGVINNLKKSDTLKIQLKQGNNLFPAYMMMNSK